MKNESKFCKLKDCHILLISFVISFVFLMICSNNSFLYAFNDNQDINWYITMGNGLLEGKIPYKDLFEQKGPIVYFVFCLFCLFNNPYRAAFFFEIICSSLFLYFSYKIIKYVLNEKNIGLKLALTAVLTFTSCYFVVGGGAVEEYCLPIFSYMLLCFIEFIRDRKLFSISRSLIFGLLIGILFFIKFTLLIFPFIIFVIITILLIKEKKIRELIKMICLFIIGVLIIAFPILVYFIANSALKDFLIAYLYNNLFLYSGSNNIFYNIAMLCGLGILPFSSMILGILTYLKNDENEYKKYYLILFGSFTIFLILSGNFPYYFLPLSVFIPLGTSAFIDFLVNRYQTKINKYITVSVYVFLVVFSLLFGNGTLELNDKKNDYIHFQIAEDIRKINNDNPTLFCYKMWDFGFYNVLGVVPNVKYYANNVFSEESFPEMYDSFFNYIDTQQAQFLLVKLECFEEEKHFILEKYDYYKEYSYVHYKDNYRKIDMNVVLLIRK